MLVPWCLCAVAQVNVNGDRNFLGAVNQSGATTTRPFREVTSDPSGACADTTWRYNTANGKLWRCLLGTWTEFTSGGGGGGGISSLGGLTGATQTFATGTAGVDFGISSAGSAHTFNLPSASASNRGVLTPADWSTFNGKLGAFGVTTTYPASGSVSALGQVTIDTSRLLPWFGVPSTSTWIEAAVTSRGSGSPGISCGAGNLGQIYRDTAATTADQTMWVCAKTGVSSYAWVLWSAILPALAAGSGIEITGGVISVDGAIVPRFLTGSADPTVGPLPGVVGQFYVRSSPAEVWFAVATNTWQRLTPDNLPASAVSSGTLATARIPDLDAAKITTGVLAAARMASGSASATTFVRGDGNYGVPPCPMIWARGTTFAAGTSYMAPGAGSDPNTGENNRTNIIPCSGTIRAVYVRVGNTAQPVDGALTLTLRVNGADTAIVSTVANSDGANVTLTNTTTVSVSAGDRISVRGDNASASASGTIAAYVVVIR
jgi:hypothetical protein